MSDGELIGLHPGDASTSDAVSSLCVPIVFVPGVMGSRLRMAWNREWDPDTKRRMSLWWGGSYLTAGLQANRGAFCEDVSATLMTSFGGTPGLDVQPGSQILDNARCVAIARKACGWAPTDTMGLFGSRSSSELVDYYAKTRHWATVLWGFYGAFLMYLEATLNHTKDDPDHPVYACGYDFRASNLDSGAALSKFIKDEVLAKNPRADDVVVVTHSMGGLVLRGALAADGDMTQKIRGVVHAAQPWNGAVSCYRRFLTGATVPLDPEPDSQAKAINAIMGNTPEIFAYNLSALPGPLQLLPNNAFGNNWMAGLDSSFDLGNVYDIYKRSVVPGLLGIVARAQQQLGTKNEQQTGDPECVVDNFKSYLVTAKQFHDQAAKGHDRTCVLYSTGLKTDTSVDFMTFMSGSISAPDANKGERWASDGDATTDNYTNIVYRQPPLGDGTVPDVSAKCPGVKALADTPLPAKEALAHAQLFTNSSFNALVANYVARFFTPSPSGGT